MFFCQSVAQEKKSCGRIQDRSAMPFPDVRHGIARLVCYHPSTEQMVNYRMHTTPDGIVTKVEVEKKVKGKNVWVEMKELSSE